MNTCLDCGVDYHYDSNNSLGASSLRCPSCRKKDTEKNKKIILFNVASRDQPKCRKCAYSRCLDALVLTDAVLFLNPAKTQEEKLEQSKKQYLLCLNCTAEIKAGEVEAKVINTKCFPIQVEFYERTVQVVRTKIEGTINYSSDAIEAEIVSGEPEAARTVRPTQRLIGQSAIGVSPL